MRKLLTDAHRAEFASLYAAGHTSYQIAAMTGWSRPAVSQALRRLGVEHHDRRRYQINDAAFDNLTPEARYWVGFFMADASVHHKTGAVTVVLQRRDRGHLEKLRRFLRADYPIYDCLAEGEYPQSGIAFRSPRIAERLAVLGVVPRKTYAARLSAELEACPHAMRGVIDGDGHVGSDDAKGPCVRLSGSHEICRQFHAFIKGVAPEYMAKVYQCPRSPTSSLVACCGQIAVKLLRVLYQEDCPCYLDRKFAKAREIIAAYGDKEWFFETPDTSWVTRELLEEMRPKHKSWNAVARELKIGTATLFCIRKRLGMPLAEGCRNGKLAGVDARRILDLRSQHGSWDAVAATLGVAKKNLDRLRRRLGLL